MAYFHKKLTQSRWNSFSAAKQILNIASELSRSRNWTEKQDYNYLQNSLNRALELVDLTINDRQKWSKGNLKELLRFREALAEFYVEENKSLEKICLLLKNFLLFNKESALVRI